MDPGSGDSMGADAASVEFMPLETETLVRWSQEARARARATREQIRRGRSQRDRLHDLVIARLRARLETMPVIEQAKGVIVAQQGCGPEEAFELLRRASQHSNVKVHELAARIVEQAASGSRRGNGLPSRGGAARPVRPEPRARPPGAANGRWARSEGLGPLPSDPWINGARPVSALESVSAGQRPARSMG